MKVSIDLQQLRDRVANLQPEVSSLDSLDDVDRSLYVQDGDRFVIDPSVVNGLPELEAAIERGRLQAENRQLRQAVDRRAVVEAVKAALLRAGVQPKLLAGAVALFLNQHRCRLKDGKVVVSGRIGTADVEAGAVRWLQDDTAWQEFTDQDGDDPDSLTSRLKGILH